MLLQQLTYALQLPFIRRLKSKLSKAQIPLQLVILQFQESAWRNVFFSALAVLETFFRFLRGFVIA